MKAASDEEVNALPNRVLKESICTSDSLDALTTFQETFFYRLIVNCDDYGRMDARPKVLASRLYPLKDIRSGQVEEALRALSSAELVTLYKVGGKPFLQMKTWERHQQIRAKRSKYPSPDSAVQDMQADDINCKQMPADASKCPRNPIQSESESNTNSCSEHFASEGTEPDDPPIITLPLNDKTEYDVQYGKWQEWQGLYPAVDVMQALRNMRGWLLANPSKRKTRKGVERFINAWLSKEQDKGGNGYAGGAKPEQQGNTGNIFADMLNRGVFDNDG